MKNLFLFLFLISLTSMYGQSEYDFETPENSINFQIFGGNLEGQMSQNIENPDASGINTSAMVVEGRKASDAPDWGGMFSNPGPVGGIDASNGGEICLDVWMDHLGTINLKLEAGDPAAPENYRQEVGVSEANTWERLCFDLDLNSLEGDMTPATGKMYTSLVLFLDLGTAGTGTEQVFYVDNISLPSGQVEECVTLFDFETTETSGVGNYFGSNQEGNETGIIANPNPTGINESENVMHYVRGGDAMTWAGAAINLETPLNANSVTTLCLKIHAPVAGNMTLKLELDDFEDPENWISTMETTSPGMWEELCFDLSIPSFEGNMTPATGKVFPKIILFPDFGTPGSGMEEDYYLDDFILKVDNTPKFYDVTFSVDMNNYTESFGGVFVSGTFNGWSGDSNPLTDDDGDGIYSATYTLDQGEIEYKFTIDNWMVEEAFDGSEECTSPIANEFKNRALFVGADLELDAVCWNSCYACGDEVNITFNVNMSEEEVSEDGVYLAGGLDFGHGDFPLTDDDGDGVYSISINRQRGYSGNYTFLNGICLPNWECKENIAGQDCSDPDNFNDRFLGPVDDDLVISTCFGQCTTDGSCEAVAKYNVTFQVDVSGEMVDGDIFIAGNTLNNWDTASDMMTDNGGGIYSFTAELISGPHEYKFVNLDQLEELMQGDDCTVTDPSGMFTNRLLLLAEADTVLATVVFGSCDLAVGTNDLVWNEELINIEPTIVSDQIQVDILKADKGAQIKILNLEGQLMEQQKIYSNQGELIVQCADWPKGMYMVQFISSNEYLTKRIIKQ